MFQMVRLVKVSFDKIKLNLLSLPLQVVMILYTLLLLEFAYRYLKDLPVRRVDPLAWTRKAKAAAEAFLPGERPVLAPREEERARLMLVGLLGATVLIFVRSIYRTVSSFTLE